MPVDLTRALAWKMASAEEVRLLQNLQGNILKSHGRHSTANIFFRLAGNQPGRSRRLLRELANYHLTNAHRQLLDADKFKQCHDGGGAFCHLALNVKAYAALAVPLELQPDDADFRGGMGAADSIQALNDPPFEEWQSAFQEEIHALLLCAHDSEAETAALSRQVQELIEDAGGDVVIVQLGKALFNADRQGIEHFGYVDGRSQPLMLVEDIQAEAEKAGIAQWNPAFPLRTALVRDRGVADPQAFGSYLVFRKLEQDVLAFKRQEQTVACQLRLQGERRELAGALLVGRFENGAPVTLTDSPRTREPLNDFNYQGDPGSRCPLHAHIRKMNPRGSGGKGEEEERRHLMPRRGIPYEDVRREVHPEALPEADNLAEFESRVAPVLPAGGVGLLFLAYNENIGQQFKFTQQCWANDAAFPQQPGGPHGIDPVIGQGHNVAGQQKLSGQWDQPGAAPVAAPFAGFVRMRGGDYFFSPSLAFLKTL